MREPATQFFMSHNAHAALIADCYDVFHLGCTSVLPTGYKREQFAPSLPPSPCPLPTPFSPPLTVCSVVVHYAVIFEQRINTLVKYSHNSVFILNEKY